MKKPKKEDEEMMKQIKEMEKIIDEKEKKEELEVSKRADEEFKKEEGRIPVNEKREERYEREAREKLELWIPKTQLGREVKTGKIKDIEEIFKSNQKILEPEIVDTLLPNLYVDTLFIGQAKGKFGGGKRRAFRQTQKKTEESNILTFGVMAIIGDKNGHLGIGYGRAAETLPAKEKAVRKAKLNITKIKRGCGSYDCSCDELHSIPMEIQGKCSSVKVKLIPAPQGTGLVIGKEMKKILDIAGIKDIYSKSFGKVRTTFNTAKACVDALNKLGEVKI
ncbi:MAG: 30S ribosomal protein S5 [Candidatus Pacearchaeota archaeon]